MVYGVFYAYGWCPWTYGHTLLNTRHLLTNMLTTKGNPGHKSHVEMKYRIIPNLSMFRIFGCIAYVHVALRQKLKKVSSSDLSQFTN